MILKKFKLSPISGDASFRKFNRKFDPKKKLSTIIVITKKKKFKNLLVYSAINHFLLEKNIRAPRLITENYKNVCGANSSIYRAAPYHRYHGNGVAMAPAFLNHIEHTPC